jgi:hypothetical protein
LHTPPAAGFKSPGFAVGTRLRRERRKRGDRETETGATSSGSVRGSRLCRITATGSDPTLGERIAADAKEFVVYSWSVQDPISPIVVAGAEARYFSDRKSNRYRDFASQLINVSIGNQHPRVGEALAVAKEHAA